MKFDQLIEYNTRNNFFKNHVENKARELVPKVFLFFEKLYMRQKQLVCTLVSTDFDRPPLEHAIKKLCETLDCWSRDMLNFDSLEKVLQLVFPPYFEYDFSRKIVSHVRFY